MLKKSHISNILACHLQIETLKLINFDFIADPDLQPCLKYISACTHMQTHHTQKNCNGRKKHSNGRKSKTVADKRMEDTLAEDGMTRETDTGINAKKQSRRVMQF
jgi:hypothetical protein